MKRGFFKILTFVEAGEVAQQLRTLAILPEDQSSVQPACQAAHDYL